LNVIKIQTSLFCLELVQQLLRRLLAVTLRVVLCPLPQVLTRLFQRLLRFPVELGISSRRVSSKVEHITRPALNNLIWQLPANSSTKSFDHLEDCRAFPCAEIPGPDTRMLFAEVIERDEMASCQVIDVDIISDRSAIF